MMYKHKPRPTKIVPRWSGIAVISAVVMFLTLDYAFVRFWLGESRFIEVLQTMFMGFIALLFGGIVLFFVGVFLFAAMFKRVNEEGEEVGSDA